MNGVWTALITPFKPSGELDLDAYRKILKDQREAKVAGVIPCGTTAESPTLNLAEKQLLIQTAIQEMKGSGVGVIAGTGTNSTSETIEFSRWASNAGVQGILVVTPYYNKPSQAGLEAHFRAIADQVSCEIMLYNVPGRTGVSLSPETIVRLAAHPKITSIKEATGNVAFTSEIVDALTSAKRSLRIFSGDDATYFPLLCVGASGVVSVASNLFPRAMVAIYNAVQTGKLKEAQDTHQRYYPLFRDLFIDSNPVPIKAAMAYAGWCGKTVRLPLAPMSSESEKTLNASLKRCGIEAGKPL